MVAKSFQSFEQIGEPFTANGRKYVVVKNPKTNNERTVRWYTEKEYHKMYPTEKEEEVVKGFKNLKQVLGFEKGYITVFSDTSFYEDWFSACSVTRWHKYWGWYIISTEEIPEDVPLGVQSYQLKWEDVSINDENLKTETEVKKVFNELVYAESKSQFVGEVAQRLALDVTIAATKVIQTAYGSKVLYVMEDNEGNIYHWLTSPRKLFKGDCWKMRGTVKTHIVDKNIKVTVLTRCSERA